MILVHETLGSDGTTTTSNTFAVGNVDEFSLAVEAGGGAGYDTSGVVTLQMSPDNGTTWTDFTSGGSDVEFTASDRHKTIEFGGALFRFSADATVDDVDCYVSGRYVVDPNL